MNQAKRVADELITTREAPHAPIGVQVTDATSPAGVRTVGVTNGGAAGAGLPFAAVVTTVDDQVIDSADALGAVVLPHPPADTVSVSFIALQATPVLPMSRWARMVQNSHRDDGTRSDCRSRRLRSLRSSLRLG